MKTISPEDSIAFRKQWRRMERGCPASAAASSLVALEWKSQPNSMKQRVSVVRFHAFLPSGRSLDMHYQANQLAGSLMRTAIIATMQLLQCPPCVFRGEDARSALTCE